MKDKISRAINNITINGKEYILNDKNEVMLFDDIQKARDYLKSNGFKNFKGIDFEEVE